MRLQPMMGRMEPALNARQKKIVSKGLPRMASIIPDKIYLSQRRILEIRIVHTACQKQQGEEESIVWHIKDIKV